MWVPTRWREKQKKKTNTVKTYTAIEMINSKIDRSILRLGTAVGLVVFWAICNGKREVHIIKIYRVLIIILLCEFWNDVFLIFPSDVAFGLVAFRGKFKQKNIPDQSKKKSIKKNKICRGITTLANDINIMYRYG